MRDTASTCCGPAGGGPAGARRGGGSASRTMIEAAGYGGRIVCRTGRSIDRVGLHGSGPTIDDTETFDMAYIPRVGFSVEPGTTFPAARPAHGGQRARPGDGLDVRPADYQRDLIVV